MKFPTILYKVPGPHFGNYDCRGCKDAGEFEQLTAMGWHPTKDEARGIVRAEAVIEAAEALEEALDEVDEPAREELEIVAKEKGQPFNKRTKAKVLASRIAEAD